jgi:hypothetical protein
MMLATRPLIENYQMGFGDWGLEKGRIGCKLLKNWVEK